MTLRENTLAKLALLPESFLQEVNDFIDSLLSQQATRSSIPRGQAQIKEAWLKWFESIEQIEVESSKTESSYGSLLLDKYRKQGLDL